MQFNFNQVRKSDRLNFPQGRIRVSTSSISIAADIIKGMDFVNGETREGERLNIAIFIDSEHGAIQLRPDPMGFAFSVKSATGTTSLATPRNVIALGALEGEYVRYGAPEDNIFVHVDKVDELSKAEEPATTTESDSAVNDALEGRTVRWMVKPEGDKSFEAEGIVGRVYESRGAMVASITVNTHQYLKAFRGRSNTTVKVDKLTVVEATE